MRLVNFCGFAFHDQVLLDDHTRVRPIATLTETAASRPLISSGPEGRILIPTFALGRSYFSSLHRGLRRLLQGWLPDSLPPDVTIQGVPDEYRSLVEARLVESDRSATCFSSSTVPGMTGTVEVRAKGISQSKGYSFRPMAPPTGSSVESAR